jgi:hypothetical protein
MLATQELANSIIATRTREVLAAKKAAGVRLGAPRSHPDEILVRVVAERLDGRLPPAIAAGLNADGVVRGDGGRWERWHIHGLLNSQDGRAALAVDRRESHNTS